MPAQNRRWGLDEIHKASAEQMLAAALTAEVETYITLEDELNEDGHRLVVRNGHAGVRTITTGTGRTEVEAPMVVT